MPKFEKYLARLFQIGPRPFERRPQIAQLGLIPVKDRPQSIAGRICAISPLQRGQRTRCLVGHRKAGLIEVGEREFARADHSAGMGVLHGLTQSFVIGDVL